MTTKTHADEIAKYIISKQKNAGSPVTNFQLQHLLYFIQVRHLKQYRTFLFPDHFAAFTAGPFVPKVYYKYNVYAGLPILLDYETKLPAPAMLFVNSTLAELIPISIYKLSGAARAKGTPWALARDAGFYEITCNFFQSALENNNLTYPITEEDTPMRSFLFKVNFQHPRTGMPVGCQIGIVNSTNLETAKKTIWQLYGADNATMADYDFTDITGKSEASIYIPMPVKNNY